MSGMSFIKRASQNHFFKYGAPFLILLVGGSFGLQHFAKLRYTFSKKKMISKDEAEMIGLNMKSEPTSIEREYEKLKEVDIDTWENIRGPRPWEDSKTVQKEIRQKT